MNPFYEKLLPMRQCFAVDDLWREPGRMRRARTTSSAQPVSADILVDAVADSRRAHPVSSRSIFLRKMLPCSMPE
jgi:hypothetical protein